VYRARRRFEASRFAKHRLAAFNDLAARPEPDEFSSVGARDAL
jgi:hypothetical protein